MSDFQWGNTATVGELTVTLEAKLDARTIEDAFIGFAGFAGISYWCDDILFKPTYVIVKEKLDDGIGEKIKAHRVEYQAFADALATIIREGHGGEYQTRAARDILFNYDNADADADTMDLMVQLAALGELRYG